MSVINNLNDDFYKFIENHKYDDALTLTLKKNVNSDFPYDFAIDQIICRQKTRRKLFHWIQKNKFLFPTRLSAEQASNECVALYHALVAGKNKKILDMTAGLGIDAMTMSLYGNNVIAVELDKIKTDILKHNIKLLELKDFFIVNDDCINYLNQHNGKIFDIIFIDPSRRNDSNQRLYAFKDTVPDIISNFNLIKNKCSKLMIKGSPMLDIKKTIEEIKECNEIHIITVKGECKEILIVCDFEDINNLNKRNIDKEINIICVDLKDLYNIQFSIQNINRDMLVNSTWEIKANCLGETDIIFDASDLKEGSYLYDPNSSIHKLRASRQLCQEFPGLKKVSPNSDFYISDRYLKNFPGRIFIIKKVLDKSSIKKLKGIRREVIVRNYIESAEKLRKRIKVKSGSDSQFIFGFRYGKTEKPIILDCEKILD